VKLSFSINGWHGYSWEDFVSMALDMRLAGIELHDVGESFFSEDSPFGARNAARTARDLHELGLGIPCIDAVCDIADAAKASESQGAIEACMATAKRLSVPFVRIRAGAEGSDGKENTIACLEGVMKSAEKLGVTLLIETVGVFADTGALRDVLNHFASDNLAALWDLSHPYRTRGEAPDTTIENLGAYVKHVHIKDSVVEDGAVKYCLIGEGSLPVGEMMNALASINYDGFVCLEWDPRWMPEVAELDVILAHFANYMNRFGDPSRKQSYLYPNATGTGTFVWKKDELIDLTFSQVLDKMVEEYPDQTCFKYTTLDYTRTYSQFRDDVDVCCRALISLGVKPGHHVAVWMTNLPQWFICFWAVTKIGAVFVSMNTAYKIHETEYLLRQSDAHTVILSEGYRDSNYAGIINELCPELQNTVPGKPLHSRRLPFLRNVITVGFSQTGCLNWEEMTQRAPSVPIEEVRRRAAATSCNDVCNMQYTSGTTGFPKGVMLTHYNVVNNGKYIGDHMDLSTADRILIQVPMFHCFGMVLSMTAAMTHGTAQFPLPYFSPKPALACIQHEHITVMNGVPTMFIAIMQHPDFPKTDCSYMRTGIMAGSNCPPELMKQAAAEMNMTQIVSVYGQTEGSPGFTMGSFEEELDVRCETVGSTFANEECKIVDPETGLDCPDGVNGEFVARGYNIMKGYYKMPKATAAAVDAEGWLHSGDLAVRDEAGYFRITGRLKDMIIRGGENIYPREIEEFLYTHPLVLDVQVIGVPDKRYGEEIMACIILKEGQSVPEEDMKKFISDSLARHKVPRYIEYVTEFPMNAAGKILKYKMREDAAARLGL
jgi:fatty-acyl-CoA synthase